MLSAIGLALDLVGAVVLVVGLFGHARALYPGWSVRSPDDVAHDHAAGLVGGSFLVSGFVLQSLTYFDVRYECSAGRLGSSRRAMAQAAASFACPAPQRLFDGEGPRAPRACPTLRPEENRLTPPYDQIPPEGA